MKIINPATEEVIREIPEDNRELVEHKFQLLQTAQQSWQAVPLEERVAVLQRFAGLLEINTERLAMTLTSEVGKPLQQSRNEINGARTRIKWLADHAIHYLS